MRIPRWLIYAAVFAMILLVLIAVGFRMVDGIEDPLERVFPVSPKK